MPKIAQNEKFLKFLPKITRHVRIAEKENIMKKETKELIYKAFGEIFIEMFNNDADVMNFTFDYNKFIAKFEVRLVDAEVKKEQGEK